MSLANQIIDFVDDVDHAILKQISAQAQESFIKTAKVLTADEREKLAEDEFALIIQTHDDQSLKKFPINDQANTWLSTQYFEKTAEQLPYVAQKIAASHLSRACDRFNLKATPTVIKQASKEVSFNRYVQAMDRTKTAQALPKTEPVISDNSSHFFALGENYAMPTAEYVKKAAAYFVDHSREFEDCEDRHTFAENVLARAKELGVTLEEKQALNKYASDSYGNELSSQISLRQTLLEFKPEMSSALSKLASKTKETTPETFARALYLFDKKAGLTRYYDRFISDPFKATFSVVKTAAKYKWEDDSGLSVTDKQLEEGLVHKHEKIASYFGKTVADSLKKHGSTVFDSLPADAKETLAKILTGIL